MRISIILAAALWCAPGCGSSYVVSSSPDADPTFATFNLESYEMSGTIVFRDGKESAGRNIVAAQDSTRFLSEDSRAATIVPTSTIRKIVFTNHGTGFLEGFGIGALAGSLVVLALSSASPHSGEFSGADYVLFFMAVGGGAGGVLGGVPGLIIGHRRTYEFSVTAGGVTVDHNP